MFLAHYYLLKYGYTWYEKHFGARPLKSVVRLLLKQFKERLVGNDTNLFKLKMNSSFTSWFNYFNDKPCEYFIDNKKYIDKACKVNLFYSECVISRRKVKEYALDLTVTELNNKKLQSGGYFKENERNYMPV